MAREPILIVAAIRALVAVSALALWAGAAVAVTHTDVATLANPGRYEVALPGAGITLGGILFVPPNTGQPTPAVIVLHGWGEAHVPGAPRVEGIARRLSGEGYVALAPCEAGRPPRGAMIAGRGNQTTS